MLLKRKDKGEPVKALQRSLNLLGSMLLIDGDFGDATEAAVVEARTALGLPDGNVADDALFDALAKLPQPSGELTAPGVTFIARQEVSSPKAYRQTYSHPVWPTANSGITIGIGYDLKFATGATLDADWGAALPGATIERLAAVSGAAGSAARLAQVADINVPLLTAIRVFLQRMMPKHIGHTRSAYPTLDTLPPHRRTALISLVFNRGSDLTGDRRSEMKRIQALLAAGGLDAVAEQFEAMTRLWDPAKERGGIERRRQEAQLWREGFEALQLA
jgi:peptidoglycan hydrolase-like protein with peptidoglycan-binding domain